MINWFWLISAFTFGIAVGTWLQKIKKWLINIKCQFGSNIRGYKPNKIKGLWDRYFWKLLKISSCIYFYIVL